jgi:hypothetical protein
MDYNSKRKKLALPEYGRHIHNMVDHIVSIRDRDERNRAARTIIDIMGSMYPYLRDVADFKHKLWDHIAIMSDFKLDIDYPYEPPSPQILHEKPKPVPYTQHDIKYRHYGYVLETMVKKIREFDDPNREILIRLLANHMKKSYLTWNRDSVEDVKIFDDLNLIAGHEVDIKDLELTDTKNLIAPQKDKEIKKPVPQNQRKPQKNFRKN